MPHKCAASRSRRFFFAACSSSSSCPCRLVDLWTCGLVELSSPPRFVLGRQSCGTSFLSPFKQLSVWHEYGPTDCAHLLFAEPQQKHAAAVQHRAEMAAMLASPATACVYRGTLVHSVAIGKVKVSRTSSSVAEDSRIPIISIPLCTNEESKRRREKREPVQYISCILLSQSGLPACRQLRNRDARLRC